MKCPYCDNTGRRKIGKYNNGNNKYVKCEVCDSHDRKEFRRQLRLAAKENRHDRQDQ